MFCNRCETNNPDASTFCNKCGQALTSQAAQAQIAAQKIPAGYPFEAQTDDKAVASLVLGVLSVFFSFLTGIPAVILGHLSRSSIKKSMGKLKGEGMALTGLILGYISVAFIPVVLIIAAIAIPNLLRARIAANEASAVGSLRTLNIAALNYRSSYPEAGYPARLEQFAGKSGQPQTAEAAGLVDASLTSGQKSGYRFSYEAKQTGGDHVDGYSLQAFPTQPGTTGIRSFCSDETGVIRAAGRSEKCSTDSAPLD
jgi:type II secretory pathway pseudopilin PulG